MEKGNYTSVKEFILLGLPHAEELTIPLFVLFLFIYVCTLVWNLLILIIIMRDPQLHTPMYFFLFNLASLDILLSSVTGPKMIANLLEERKVISFPGCVIQLYFYHFLASTECFLYTVMAYDRYAAICHPLHYTKIMSKTVCLKMASGTWLTGFTHSMIHTVLTFRLPYCRSNLIQYFFCDIPPILKLACSSTYLNEVVIMVDIGIVTLSCFVMILISYGHIVLAILKISTAEGRRRTFSTCVSHITVVMFLLGPVSVIYARPQSIRSMDGAFGVFNTMVAPMLNPIVYTLRNKEVKSAIKKLRERHVASINT
ncbi:olfactory receptor 10G4-like [Microcaecilia unicolor]|uniref:Olfactory receptor 10G4-like n=1 Tax=Microcaecilia unicolor TaxID=1415580 RepID=A0A6P7WXE1_9AMPH|nr:olfactory receptor 10G4-like [Microcaecilia unicolor]